MRIGCGKEIRRAEDVSVPDMVVVVVPEERRRWREIHCAAAIR